MSRVQVSKSEQITPNLSLVLDYDQPLTRREDILKVLREAISPEVDYEKFAGSKTVYIYKHGGQTDYFLTGSITYLSKPHPLFKKRLQLKKWFKDFYHAYQYKSKTRIHMIGIYHYDGMIVFVEFSVEDYINRKLNSSAAHVYSNDIYQACIHGHFEKTDRNGNRLVVVPSRNYKSYLNNSLKENSLLGLFKKFNEDFTFGEWIDAITAIREMKLGKWFQWKGTEWPGWFLEYRITEFIKSNNCRSQMDYIGNLKRAELLDFDLYFFEQNYYGDLKASDIAKYEAPANDKRNVIEAVNECGRLWYIIYEHETIKDTSMNNEMAIARMNEVGNPYEAGGEISYRNRMKHSVNFKRMEILELNRINMSEVLRDFNQGHQPTGEARAPKFKIDKRNIDNYIIFSYDYSPDLKTLNSNRKHQKIAEEPHKYKQ